MTLYDLNEDQRLELKQSHLTKKMDERGESPSYGELAEADSLVSDSELEKEYGGTEFSPDDFCCGVAADRDGVLDEIEAWAKRALAFKYYSTPGNGRVPHLHAQLGIEWALQRLLDHIEAVR